MIFVCVTVLGLLALGPFAALCHLNRFSSLGCREVEPAAIVCRRCFGGPLLRELASIRPLVLVCYG
jgi:hypothetical protein